MAISTTSSTSSTKMSPGAMNPVKALTVPVRYAVKGARVNEPQKIAIAAFLAGKAEILDESGQVAQPKQMVVCRQVSDVTYLPTGKPIPMIRAGNQLLAKEGRIYLAISEADCRPINGCSETTTACKNCCNHHHTH